MYPPVWYPGKSLKSVDLYNLEAYMFERNRLPSRGHGVVTFQPNHTVIAKADEDGLNLQINELIGLTETGSLVCIDQADFQISPEQLPEDAKTFDFYLSVGRAFDEEPDPPVRFQCRLTVPADKPPHHRPDQLYLGRFIRQSAPTAIWSQERLPAVLSLAAIEPSPPSEIHRFQETLAEKLGEWRERPIQLNASHQTARDHFFHLAYHWANIPIHDMEQGLGYINWLLRGSPLPTLSREKPTNPPADLEAQLERLRQLLPGDLHTEASAPEVIHQNVILRSYPSGIILNATVEWRQNTLHVTFEERPLSKFELVFTLPPEQPAPTEIYWEEKLKRIRRQPNATDHETLFQFEDSTPGNRLTLTLKY